MGTGQYPSRVQYGRCGSTQYLTIEEPMSLEKYRDICLCETRTKMFYPFNYRTIDHPLGDEWVVELDRSA